MDVCDLIHILSGGWGVAAAKEMVELLIYIRSFKKV